MFSFYPYFFIYYYCFGFVFADESPGACVQKTTLAATIMKRGSQDSGTEGHFSETDLGETR